MGRVDNFKEARFTRIKMFVAVLTFMSVLTVGIFTVDYSINSIVSDTPKLEIIKVAEASSNMYTIDFANRKYNLNTYYLSRDINKIKKRLSEIF
jgi:hypothetical protein